MKLTHLDKNGNAHMVDVSAKPPVLRIAVASGSILLQPATITLLRENGLKKGDALACARIAGIMAAKKTAELIPLCHGIAIDQVAVEFEITGTGVTITASARCTDKTGIEMEALTAVAVAALTIYDMCKAVDKQMVIGGITLIKKTKGDAC